MDLLPVALGTLGVIVGAVLSFFGVRFTARQNAKAAQDAAAVSSRQVDVEEWRAIVAALREEVGRLSTRVDNLEKKREDDRDYIETLEAEARAHDARYRTLLRYTRDVLAWAARVVPDHDPPPAPEALREDLPNERTTS
ncbi:membrane protein [Arthrobacter phage Crewmate]|uniref:Membrane protein n=1 Tax=Arthrobacter phage Crewmate TaxID=2832317 RepID=A0AA49B4D4_9CAUD|nr:membrane protein [Arthrobacter phage Crewmate]UIW13275.1 membrane protein [Arthrobacter phage Crewmate]WGH21198.1 membrane protein [Arthrobacter phage ObiToo]